MLMIKLKCNYFLTTENQSWFITSCAWNTVEAGSSEPFSSIKEHNHTMVSAKLAACTPSLSKMESVKLPTGIWILLWQFFSVFRTQHLRTATRKHKMSIYTWIEKKAEVRNMHLKTHIGILVVSLKDCFVFP